MAASSSGPSLRPARGLCDSCRHQRLVPNTRGSVFSLCQRSRTDADYPRYPKLPVRRCAGYVARTVGDDQPEDAAGAE